MAKVKALKAPKITLGGVALEADTIEWGYRAGVEPQETLIRVSRAVADLVIAQGNGPLILEFDVQRLDGTVLKTDKRRWNRVYVTEQTFPEPFAAGLVLQDMRWRWRGKTYTRRVNVKRRLNDFDVLEEGGGFEVPGQSQLTVAGDPTGIRQQYLRLPKQRWFNWSWNPDTGEGWTALELAEDILRTVLEPEGGYGGRKQGLQDNGYQPDEEMFLAEDASSGLHHCLGFARAQGAVWPDGKYYLYPYDAGNVKRFLPTGAPVSIMSPLLYRRNLSRIRPKKIQVQFEAEIEYPFRFDTTDTDNDDNPQYPKLVNVIQLPQDQELVATKADGTKETRKYRRGTWLPIDDVLAAWEDEGGVPGSLGDTSIDSFDALIRRGWMGALEPAYLQGRRAALNADFFDLTAILRLGAIRQSYRQTYRVPDWFVERLVRMRAERVERADPFTGYRIPSPVYQQFCLVLMIKPNNRLGQRFGAKNFDSFVDADGNDIDDPDDFGAAPFRVSVLDEQLGVIRVSPYRDLSGATMDLIPSQLDNPDNFLLYMEPGASTIAEANSLSADHKVEIPLTLVLATPNSEEQWYQHEVTASQGNANGPALHDFYRPKTNRDTARFRVKRPGDLAGELLNREMTKALAVNEARRVYHSLNDYWVGEAVYDGLHDVQIFGHARSVIQRFGADGVTTTHVDLRDIPVAPDVLTLLPKALKRVLQRSGSVSGER